MFEGAELGQELSRDAFRALVPPLREALLDAQFRLAEDPRLRVVVLIAGVEGAGKGQILHRLMEWMDARGILVHALGDATLEEEQRPPFFRFWRRLPPLGSVAVFLGSWYTGPILERGFGRLDDAHFDGALSRIAVFERMLSAEGTLLLKFWLHISKAEQARRLDRLASDPAQAWRVTERDRALQERYDAFVRVCSHAIRRTSTGVAPWTIVEATDDRWRDATVAQTILEQVTARLDAPAPPPEPPERLPAPRERHVLSVLDLSRSVSKDDYEVALDALQTRIGRLALRLGEAKRSAVLVFEGADAAGKGGAIRRVFRKVDPRFWRAVAVAAPTDEERAQPYLWRFWRHLPKHGRFTVFDRSWYGRVLVERVEGFCSPSDVRRAWAEINAFEEQLVDAGVVLCKFWLHISADEQLARFEAREKTGYKRYKLTDEDWRNREKWDAYVTAACDMVERTSTELAPWTLVPAQDKRFGRLMVLRTVAETLEAALGIASEDALQVAGPLEAEDA